MYCTRAASFETVRYRGQIMQHTDKIRMNMFFRIEIRERHRHQSENIDSLFSHILENQ